MRYRATRPADTEMRERLRTLAAERRPQVLLRREGHAVNKKRVQRLYREGEADLAPARRPQACGSAE